MMHQMMAALTALSMQEWPKVGYIVSYLPRTANDVGMDQIIFEVDLRGQSEEFVAQFKAPFGMKFRTHPESKPPRPLQYMFFEIPNVEVQVITHTGPMPTSEEKTA